MSTEKKTLEVLRASLDDTLNLMDEKSMDLMEGGTCTRTYCVGVHCPEVYIPSQS